MSLAQTTQQVELPPVKGFYRTPFGFYVVDHKSPANLEWLKTYEWIQKDGAILIPNSFWSQIATLTREELEVIENPDIRRETQEAQRLMLEYPLQFVNLLVKGNRVLAEPCGIGVRVLDRKLENGPVEVYDHDASRIRIGRAQEKYNYGRMLVDESVKEDDVKVVVRGGEFGHQSLRFGLYVRCNLSESSPDIAGLGCRPGDSNQAYLDVQSALRELAEAGKKLL